MPLSFAHFWQNEEHSDVDVVLTVVPHNEGEAEQQLAHFPGHSVLLSSSHMISAQISRWQHHDRASEEPSPKRRRTRSSTAGTHSTSRTDDSSSRPQLVLELQDASEQAAALAVLQSLYAVAPLHKLLAPLRQEQQLQAAVLADKWQVPDVSTAVVRALQGNVLSRELLQQFVQLPAVPNILLPLLGPVLSACMRNTGAGAGIAEDAKRLLLSVLGDVDEVLGDAALREALLALPLPAMKLLLSSDDLKVASEDTVLAAAREYADNAGTAAVYQTLAPHIRCPHLSIYWLSACVHAKDKGLSALFGPHSKQLRKLLMLQLADYEFVSPKELQEHLQKAPASWMLGRRTCQAPWPFSKAVHSVQLVWPLDVSDLRSAAQRSCSRKGLVEVNCPGVSRPLDGIMWSMKVQALWDDEQQATQLGLFCIPRNVPRNCYYRFRGRFDVTGNLGLSYAVTSGGLSEGSRGRGRLDYFGVGWMSGGWDEEAWVTRGLPAAGELHVTLTVTADMGGGFMCDDAY